LVDVGEKGKELLSIEKDIVRSRFGGREDKSNLHG